MSEGIKNIETPQRTPENEEAGQYAKDALILTENLLDRYDKALKTPAGRVLLNFIAGISFLSVVAATKAEASHHEEAERREQGRRALESTHYEHLRGDWLRKRQIAQEEARRRGYVPDVVTPHGHVVPIPVPVIIQPRAPAPRVEQPAPSVSPEIDPNAPWVWLQDAAHRAAHEAFYWRTNPADKEYKIAPEDHPKIISQEWIKYFDSDQRFSGWRDDWNDSFDFEYNRLFYHSNPPRQPKPQAPPPFGQVPLPPPSRQERPQPGPNFQQQRNAPPSPEIGSAASNAAKAESRRPESQAELRTALKAMAEFAAAETAKGNRPYDEDPEAHLEPPDTTTRFSPLPHWKAAFERWYRDHVKMLGKIKGGKSSLQEQDQGPTFRIK